MSTPFSKPCQYAILAMTYLARSEPDRLVSIREISQQADIPLPFLGKIVSQLGRHGLVLSRRGPHGGVALKREPGQVTVGDIVDVIDGPLMDGSCALGFAECNDVTPCPIHDSWKRARLEIERTLHLRTLEDLVEAQPRE